MTATLRGARVVRREVLAHLRTHLPDYLPWLREEWGDPEAFPPAGPDTGAGPLPDDDAWWPYEGHPVDRWPVINVVIEESSTTRNSHEQDATVWTTTYTCSAYVWINIDGREESVDCRDDLQTAMRIVLLDQPLPAELDLSVVRDRYRDVYGAPLPAKGQRFTVAGRSAFSVRAEERIVRPPLVTVPAGGQIEVDVPVGIYPPPPDVFVHPALQ